MSRCSGALVLLGLLSAQAQPVSGPLVSNESWPRSTGLVTWTRDVMRIEGLEKASETAQGKAFFQWLRLFSRMAVGGMIQAYEGPYGQERYVTDAHKNLFVYGWGFCDTTSRIAEAAWKEYKRDSASAMRVCVQHENQGYHTMYRLRLDGRYGAFDPRYGYYLVERDTPDARVLDWPQVGRDVNILRNREFRYRSKPFFEIFGLEWERALLLQPAYFESESEWRAHGAPIENVFGDSAYEMGTKYHDMDFVLPRGTSIERFWDNTAREFYMPAGKHTIREEPFRASGRFYRVTETSLDGNWPKHDPNYRWAEPYLATVPKDQEYPADLSGGKTIGQAWGEMRYQPNLKTEDYRDALSGSATLVHAAQAPYLRPARTPEGGEATFEFYCPYVLTSGNLETELAGAGTVVEIRSLQAKASREGEPEVWSEWQELFRGAGRHETELGRSRFNGRDVSIHGVYRFQIRVRVEPQAGRTEAAGLSGFRLNTRFENGIMSIPRLQAGRNRMRFEVRDAARLRAPLRIVYRYETPAGSREHRQRLSAADFRNGQAEYAIDAPGLRRCRSVEIAYGTRSPSPSGEAPHPRQRNLR